MRLTKEAKSGGAILNPAAFPEYAAETLDREMRAFDPFKKVVQALAKYEAAESLKLPCNLGAPLYWISPEDDDGNEIPTINTNKVAAILLTPDGVRVCDESEAQECIENSSEIDTPYAYLDREKAEKGLSEYEAKT